MSSCRCRYAPGVNRHGFALVVVIVVMLLASFFASQLILTARTEEQVALNAGRRASCRALAAAGVQLALFHLLDQPVDFGNDALHTPLLYGREYEVRLQTGTAGYSVVSEAGKIDLNNGAPELLDLFLRYHGLTPEERAVVIDSLADWRDADDLVRLHGAEKEYYQTLDPPYIPRNGAIEEPAEFQLIRGTAKLAGKFPLAEVFTVNNPQGKINANHLTPAMLAFLAEGDAARIQAYWETRKTQGNVNSTLARQIFGNERFAEIGQYLTYEQGWGAALYSITAIGRRFSERGEIVASPAVKITALVRIFGDSYQFMSWQEQGI